MEVEILLFFQDFDLHRSFFAIIIQRKYRITEEQAKEEIKAIDNSLRIHYGLRV